MSAAATSRVPPRADDRERALAGQEHGGQVGGRIAVDQRAADGPAVAHLLVGDERRRLADRAQLGLALQVGVTRHRADPPLAVLALRAAQARDLAQVHEQRRRRQAQLHQRQQRVPAGQHLGVLAAVAQRLERLVERVGCDVVELGRDHWDPPFASLMAVQTRMGVSGMSR